jgi:hypothetical protein
MTNERTVLRETNDDLQIGLNNQTGGAGNTPDRQG